MTHETLFLYVWIIGAVIAISIRGVAAVIEWEGAKTLWGYVGWPFFILIVIAVTLAGFIFMLEKAFEIGRRKLNPRG